MKKLLSIIAMLLFCGSAFAIPYTAGPYLVDIEVRSSAMVPILDAKVSCWLSGKFICIRARAQGYDSVYEEFQSVENQQVYKRDLVLPDIKKRFHACDTYGVPIKSVYFIKDQYGFPSNVYGLKAYIPIQDWKEPISKNVDVFDADWIVPIKNSCEIKQVEEFYEVTMTFTRKAAEWSTTDLLVAFDGAVPPTDDESVRVWLRRLARVEKFSDRCLPGAAQALATFLFNVLPPQTPETRGGEPLPATLQALYDQADRFEALHRNPREK